MYLSKEVFNFILLYDKRLKAYSGIWGRKQHLNYFRKKKYFCTFSCGT